MPNYSPSLIALLALVLLLLIYAVPAHGNFAADDEIRLTIIGRVVNAQSIGIGEAELRVLVDGNPHTIVVADTESKVAHTNSDGSFVVDLTVPKSMSEKVTLEVYKPGFRSVHYRLQQESIHLTGGPSYVRVPDIIQSRETEVPTRIV